MALWSQQGGDMQAAAQWRARLAKAAPDSPGLQDLDNAKKMSQVPQGQLSLARQQARGGNIPGALATGAACSMAIRRLPGWRRNIT